MSADVSDLLALVLELTADGAGDEEAIDSLVEAAHGSASTLMGACANALSLVRDMPYDAANERTLRLLTIALQRAVHAGGDVPVDDRATLLRHIVEFSGGAAMAPGAVAERVAELDASLDKLRAAGDSGTPASP